MRNREGEEGPDFKVRSTFEDDLGHFMHEKDLMLKGLDDLITDQQNALRAKFAKHNALLGGHIKP